MISESYFVNFRTANDPSIDDVITLYKDDFFLFELYGEDARHIWTEFHETVTKDFTEDISAFDLDRTCCCGLEIDVPEGDEPSEIGYASLLYFDTDKIEWNKAHSEVFHIYGDLQHVLNLAKKTLQEASNHIFNLAV